MQFHVYSSGQVSRHITWAIAKRIRGSRDNCGTPEEKWRECDLNGSGVCHLELQRFWTLSFVLYSKEHKQMKLPSV